MSFVLMCLHAGMHLGSMLPKDSGKKASLISRFRGVQDADRLDLIRSHLLPVHSSVTVKKVGLRLQDTHPASGDAVVLARRPVGRTEREECSAV